MTKSGMKNLGTAAEAAANQISQGKLPSERLNHSEIVPLRKDPTGKRRIAEGVVLYFDTLKTYGKDPGQIENVTKMFLWVLADYPVEKILEAMAYYARHNSEFPAPADIANIIQRGNKPPLERSVYVAVSKKRPEERTAEEWGYMREYEEFLING